MLQILRSYISKRPWHSMLCALLILAGAALIGLYVYGGTYAINVILRRGGSLWLAISDDDPRISPSMRLALREPAPAASAGKLEWRSVANGFEVAELPVIADGSTVDQLLLARIDPALFRFQMHNAPAGNRELADWMKELGAALIINGSYFTRYGTPDTPLVSQGVFLGPREYDARHGALVASATSVGLIDLAQQSWPKAFEGATNAAVSYPLLIAADGTSRVKGDRRWLANRSFVGEDDTGHIILGTTRDAFFSLERFAAFLKTAPLRLKLALNLDGGPVACQGISIEDFHRDFCGRWEVAVRDRQLKLLAPLVGTQRWGLPVILAVLRK